MKMRIVSIILLLIVPGLLYASELSIHPQSDTVIKQLSDLENMADPAFERLVQSSSYKTLTQLAQCSTTLHKRLAQIVPIKYWTQPLAFIRMWPEDPLNRVEAFTEFFDYCRSIAFSSKNDYAATGFSFHFLLWQLQKPARTIAAIPHIDVIGKKAQTIKQLEGPLEAMSRIAFRAVAFSPDGTLLAGALRNSIFLWEMPSGNLRDYFKIFELGNSIAFSPNGQMLAYNSQYSVKLIDLNTHTVKKEILSNCHAFFPIFAFSPDGSFLACTSNCKTVALWSTKSDNIEQVQELNNECEIKSMAFSPDSGILAFGFENGTIRLWAIKAEAENKVTCEPTKVLIGYKGPVNFLAFSHHAVLASASYKNAVGSDNTIRLWNIGTGDQIASLKGYGPIAFSPDGQLLAARGTDGHMGLWQKAVEVPH